MRGPSHPPPVQQCMGVQVPWAAKEYFGEVPGDWAGVTPRVSIAIEVNQRTRAGVTDTADTLRARRDTRAPISPSPATPLGRSAPLRAFTTNRETHHMTEPKQPTRAQQMTDLGAMAITGAGMHEIMRRRTPNPDTGVPTAFVPPPTRFIKVTFPSASGRRAAATAAQPSSRAAPRKPQTSPARQGSPARALQATRDPRAEAARVAKLAARVDLLEREARAKKAAASAAATPNPLDIAMGCVRASATGVTASADGRSIQLGVVRWLPSQAANEPVREAATQDTPSREVATRPTRPNADPVDVAMGRASVTSGDVTVSADGRSIQFGVPSRTGAPV
jgi:hypothetical protein